MRHRFLSALVLVLAGNFALGAERVFNFSEDSPQHLALAGFRSTVGGVGKPGDWKVVMDQVPPLIPPLTSQAPAVTTRPVLAQTAKDSADNHYPLLIFEEEAFGDFNLTTRFKIVEGTAEQMAGVAFRIQNEKNYYYVRASALGNSFYFFKFVNGELIGPIGSKMEIKRGVWHELGVECKGSQVSCSLDGKVVIAEMRQDTFSRGKIGFWTKSDSVSYFADTRITYTPLEIPARSAVREMVKKYPRLIDVRLYVFDEGKKSTRLVASKNLPDLGEPGGATEADVLSNGRIYYGKGKDSVTVTMPLRDRNGEPMAAARLVMKSFTGQTEQNALGRAQPLVKELQARIQSAQDFVE